MIAICSIEVSATPDAEVSAAELIGQEVSVAVQVSAEVSAEELITQDIQFEDSDL